MDRLFLYFLRLILFFPCDFGMLRPLRPTISQVFFISVVVDCPRTLHFRPHPPPSIRRPSSSSSTFALPQFDRSSSPSTDHRCIFVVFVTAPSTQVFVIIVFVIVFALPQFDRSSSPSTDHHNLPQIVITFHRLLLYLRRLRRLCQPFIDPHRIFVN